MSTAADRPEQGEDLRVNPGADRRTPEQGTPRLPTDAAGEAAGVGHSEPADDAGPDEIEADIARTRRDLGETVAALSDRLDPTAQAEQQLHHLSHRAHEQLDRALDQVGHARDSARSTFTRARHTVAETDSPLPPLLAAAAGAAVFAGIGLLLIRRPRSRPSTRRSP